jgi:hypothetical protein
MACDRSLLSFWRNILIPSSELKSMPGKQENKQAAAGLLIAPEDGCRTFFLLLVGWD